STRPGWSPPFRLEVHLASAGRRGRLRRVLGLVRGDRGGIGWLPIVFVRRCRRVGGIGGIAVNLAGRGGGRIDRRLVLDGRCWRGEVRIPVVPRGGDQRGGGHAGRLVTRRHLGGAGGAGNQR